MILRDITFSRQYNRERYGVDRAEQIGAPYWPSLDGALRELRRLSGKLPGVRYPLGGTRTYAEGLRANPYLDPTISDHYFAKGRAYDADNRGEIITGIAVTQGVTFTRATQIYYGTLAKFGWRNIQVNGEPFPLEPWHNANHSLSPAGYGGTPLPSTPSTPPAPTIENEDPMTDARYVFSKNRLNATIDADSAIRTPSVSTTLPDGTPYTVLAMSAYYQPYPTAPLHLQREGIAYVKDGTKNYAAPLGSTVETRGYNTNGGKSVDCNGEELAALIHLRGVVTG